MMSVRMKSRALLIQVAQARLGVDLYSATTSIGALMPRA